MDGKEVIRVGTRGSQLALVQTDQVIAALKEKNPKLLIERVILHTKGDKILDKPLIEFGGKGAFIGEFEKALLDGRIDLAVHSAKDMPAELADGLVIAGALPRADVRDVLVARKGLFVYEKENLRESVLPRQEMGEIHHTVIGTGSLRRQFQLKILFPGIQCVSIRGNVLTRLQKVENGECDGVILAAAGLERLGLLEEKKFDYYYFSRDEMVPAGGQGIIAIEGRCCNDITSLAGSISNQSALLELEAERRVLQILEAGCHEAIGVVSEILGKQITIQAVRENAGVIYRSRQTAEIEKRMLLAEQVARSLKREG